MSRNMEVVDEMLEEAVSEPALRVEGICGDVADRLIKKHDYTTRAEVRMEAEYVIREQTPATDRPTQATADIIASATAHEDGTTSEEIGCHVVGMTVCPCSQGMSESRARDVLEDLDVERETMDAFLETVPQPGHSQRGHATLTVETADEPRVDLNELIEVARDSMSARIYNLAKRPDEDHMTFKSHSNAKFVEDCVRSMAEGLVETYPELPEDAIIRMEQSNDESIHQHNAHAERVAEFGQLKAEVNDE
jgi:GTP cyclohydrolase-4